MTGQQALAVVAVALCGYRLARLVTQDTMFERFRAWMFRFAYQATGYSVAIEADTWRPRSWAREKAYQWISCPYCFGVWTTAGAWWAWHSWPWSWARPAVMLGAAIGVQALASVYDH